MGNQILAKSTLFVMVVTFFLSGCANSTVTLTAVDTNGTPQSGLPIYVFNGPAKTDYFILTNDEGRATFHLPKGNYHFRLDKYDLQFWSDTVDHCAVPGCTAATITIPAPVIVKVVDANYPYSGHRVILELNFCTFYARCIQDIV